MTLNLAQSSTRRCVLQYCVLCTLCLLILKGQGSGHRVNI